ncbi:MAG: nucleotidyltransferase domain-containing protein [Anaerolineae bacterium]
MRRIPNLRDWEKLAAINPMLPNIARVVLRRVPGAQTLVFYGSQITGDTDQYSDYDVLIIAPSDDVPGFRERAEIEKVLEKQHGIKVQVAATSPTAAWLELRLKLYLRHWLEQGVILGDGSTFPEPLPPLAKEGARVSLGSIENDLELMIEDGDGRRSRGEVLFCALRMLLLLRAAIQGDYSVNVRRKAEELLGTTAVRRLRNPKGRLSADDVAHLEMQVERLLAEVRELAAKMAENTSDEDLREQVEIYRREAA